MLYLKSAIEVGGIYAEAAQEVYYDTRKWLGRVIIQPVKNKIAEVDEWACDYGNEDLE